MSTSNNIDLKGHPITLSILNPNVAAKAAINFTTYMPKLDLEKAEPIIRMVLHNTTDGGVTTEIEYTPNDRIAFSGLGTLAGGKYVITDEDTINLGDATNTALHTFRLEITYWANRQQNT